MYTSKKVQFPLHFAPFKDNFENYEILTISNWELVIENISQK